MSLLIVSLDITIVNVALPSIHRSFDTSMGALQWVVDIYTVTGASLLMLSASTGDRIGRRRMFQIGLCIFGVGSLLCSLAPSLGILIAARGLQAVGGSMLNPMALSVIRNVFVEPRDRAVALGVWGAVPGISMALGPVVGGFLVDESSWRAVFVINLPICALALVLSRLVMPESRAERPRSLDPVGQALIALALGTMIFGIIHAPGAGWLSGSTLALGVASAGGWIAMVLWELRRRQPVLEVRAFRSVPLAGASALAIATYSCFAGFLFLNTLYLQDVRGLSPLAAGLRLLPLAAVTLVAAPISGRVLGARGPRFCLTLGGLALLLAGAMLTQLTDHTSSMYLDIVYVLIGGGVGIVNPPITFTAVSGMPSAMAGVAAAVATTSRQTGQAVGVAVLGAIAGGTAVGSLGYRFVTASHAAWWVVTGLGAFIALLGVVTTTAWARATAVSAAERLMADP